MVRREAGRRAVTRLHPFKKIRILVVQTLCAMCGEVPEHENHVREGDWVRIEGGPHPWPWAVEGRVTDLRHLPNEIEVSIGGPERIQAYGVTITRITP